MATKIQEDRGRIRRPELINKIDIEANVNDAILLTGDDGLITALDDKTLRIWLRRQTGKYWPSVCHALESAPTALFFHTGSNRLFCGCESGLIHEFLVGDDFNKITLQCTYLGHQSRINALFFSNRLELLFSVCREKKLNWYTTSTAEDDRRFIRGTYTLTSWGMSIAFDETNRQCFVGDSSGEIHYLRIQDDNRCQLNTKLSGHTGSVPNLLWNVESQQLFSGSFDTSVVVWNVGSSQGLAVELNGHSDRLVGLSYHSLGSLLLTCSADGHIGVWPMNVKRNETPKWLQSDSCQLCSMPFFWNIREMWSKKQIGSRQHHCRKCGRAVCDKCCQAREPLPLFGYETAQRICTDCIKTLKSDETRPLACFYDISQATIRMDYNQRKKVMMTVGTDRTIRIWDMSSVV